MGKGCSRTLPALGLVHPMLRSAPWGTTVHERLAAPGYAGLRQPGAGVARPPTQPSHATVHRAGRCADRTQAPSLTGRGRRRPCPRGPACSAGGSRRKANRVGVMLHAVRTLCACPRAAMLRAAQATSRLSRRRSGTCSSRRRPSRSRPTERAAAPRSARRPLRSAGARALHGIRCAAWRCSAAYKVRVSAVMPACTRRARRRAIPIGSASHTRSRRTAASARRPVRTSSTTTGADGRLAWKGPCRSFVRSRVRRRRSCAR